MKIMCVNTLEHARKKIIYEVKERERDRVSVDPAAPSCYRVEDTTEEEI